MPLVEIAGEKRVLIENHKGVTEYDADRICIRVKYGQICVCGENLTLSQMTGACLVICGRIDSITLLRGR
jgi:sporulation protein YqfC